MTNNKVTSSMSKMRGGGSRPLLDNVQKKDAFFLCLPLVVFTESSIYIYILYIYTYICICPLSMHFFKVSHWPSDHMISLRPLIGQPSFTTKLRGCGGGGGIFLFFFLP